MRKNFTFFFMAIVSIAFGQTIPQYYNNVDFNQPQEIIKQQLTYLITTTHHEQGYNTVWSTLDNADEDPDNPNNVLLIYGYDNIPASKTERSRAKTKKNNVGGTRTDKWEREHVFAKSLASPVLIGSGNRVDAGSDAHNLRAIDSNWNATRNNNIYEDAQGYARKLQSGNWYPGDEWKGDVARIIMYMYVRWGTRTLPNNIGAGGSPVFQVPDMPDMFLKWNREDPPSAFEIRRNNEIWKVQANRNPFIDNPYLATIVWGGEHAQDTWGLSSTLSVDDFFSTMSEPTIYPSVVSPGENITISKPSNHIQVYSMTGGLVYSFEKSSKEFRAPTHTGVYIVRFLTDENNKVISKKFIVK